MRRHLAPALLAGLLAGSACAAPASAAGLEAVAAALEGRLVVGGATFYRVARVLSIDEQDGLATLHAEADPLYEGQYAGNPEGQTSDGRLYYNARIDPEAACGLPGASTRLDTSNLLVFHQGAFVTLREAFPGMRLRAWERPINFVAPQTLAKLRQCAGQRAQAADAMPFRSIAVHAGAQRIAEVGRTSAAAFHYEEEPGEELIGAMTHLAITPKKHAAPGDFTVSMRAVSVMHCDYEGPHIELDRWKQGLGPEVPLRRAGAKFMVAPRALAASAPPFPRYTPTELRRAIAQHWGNAGLASSEEARPCQPLLRGYRFAVRYQSRLVQELFVAFAGGC